PLHQIFKRSAAPVAVDGVDELLPVTGRAMKVNHDDDVPARGKEFGIPAIRPVVSPRALRATMDEELHRILLAGVEVRRLDEEALNFIAVGAGEPEGFKRGHGYLGEDGVVEVGQRPREGTSLLPLETN